MDRYRDRGYHNGHSSYAFVEQKPKVTESLTLIRDCMIERRTAQQYIVPAWLHMTVVRVGTPRSVRDDLIRLGVSIGLKDAIESFYQLEEALAGLSSKSLQTEIAGWGIFGGEKRLLVARLKRVSAMDRIRQPILGELRHFLSKFGVTDTNTALRLMPSFQGATDKAFTPHITFARNARLDSQVKKLTGVPVELCPAKLVRCRQA